MPRLATDICVDQGDIYHCSPSHRSTNCISKLRAVVARSDSELAAAHALVKQRYAWRGYTIGERDTALANHAVTLIATDEQMILGTLTLRFDSEAGLGVDETYQYEVDAVRQKGRFACELTRLALARNVDSQAVFTILFRLAYEIGKILRNVTDVFIEVNPRHERFYRQVLDFAVAAGQRICPRVQAPAVLLHLDVSTLKSDLALPSQTLT